MCATEQNHSIPPDSRQVIANVRRQCAALGVDLSPLSDDELYHVLYTAWWITVVCERDPNNPDELARTLRLLREAAEQESAA